MKKSTAAPKVKGHWPKGKRRNADSGDWSRTRLKLAALLNECWVRGVISKSALSVAIGVDRNTVTRWIDGTDRPSPENQLLVREWLRQVSSVP